MACSRVNILTLYALSVDNDNLKQLAAALTTVLLFVFTFGTVLTQVTDILPVDGHIVGAPEHVGCV
jgi:hypothetical protein